MEKLKNFGSFLLLLLLGTVVGVIIFLFSFWFFVAFLGMLGLVALAWAIGIPITVRERKKKIGYIRWFKFYPSKRQW